MRKEFLINSGLLLVLNAIIKPAYLIGIERSVQNAVGVESYGLYFSLIGFIYLFQFINDFGFAQYLRKYIAEFRAEIPTAFVSILFLKITLSAIFILALWLFNLILGYELTDYTLLMWIGVSMVLASMVQVFRSALTGMGFYRIDSFLSILDKLLLIIFCAVFLFTDLRDRFDIYVFVYGQVITLGLTMLCAAGQLFNRVDIRWTGISGEHLRLFLMQSAPFALIIFLMSAYSRIDAIMLRNLLPDGLYHAGSYAAGYRIFEAANMLAFLVSALLLPMVAYLISRKESLDDLINLALRIIVLMTFGSAIVCAFYNEEIMQLLYTDYSEGWGNILFWLMLGFIPLGMGHIFGVLLMARNKVGTLNIIFVVALVSNIALNLLLIPKYQAIGAAVATFATQWIVIVPEIILYNRVDDWQLQQSHQLIRFVISSVAVVTLIWLLMPFSWMIQVMVSSLSILGFSLLFNLLPVADVRRFIAQRQAVKIDDKK